MIMTDYEIREKFKKHGGDTVKSKREYIKTLAELNGCTGRHIQNLLECDTNIADKSVERSECIKGNNYKGDAEKTNTDGVRAVLTREALCSYICCLTEDNERLRGLVIRQGQYGRRFDSVGRQIEVNEQKISVMRKWVMECD